MLKDWRKRPFDQFHMSHWKPPTWLNTALDCLRQKYPPQILSQLWLSLFDCHTAVYSQWGSAVGGDQRRQASIFGLWILGIKNNVKGVCLQIPKHRGGAWDDTSVRYEKKFCTLDCKWGIDILYGASCIYSAWSSRAHSCVLKNACCLQEARRAFYSLGYFQNNWRLKATLLYRARKSAQLKDPSRCLTWPTDV